MKIQSPYQTIKRAQTLITDKISTLPIVMLMPHSACNCKCIMCDIWKGNANAKQLSEGDIQELLKMLTKLGTKQVVMTGGEALLNPNFFELCKILAHQNIKITLLSSGLLLKQHAENITKYINDLIVSLDGPEETHDTIRNIKGAYQKTKLGIDSIRQLKPGFKITGRTVIHKLNFKVWDQTIDAAQELKLDQISFLPADISSSAFNREVPWGENRQKEILIEAGELDLLEEVINDLITKRSALFSSHYIAESPEKINKIYQYYRAQNNLDDFPYKMCNAPWVSTVIEADGSVKPCFFHDTIGNIKEASLANILNGAKGYQFRSELNVQSNPTCKKCVCSLYLPPNKIVAA